MGLGVFVLSDEDKARIQAEEQYRAEARAAAEGATAFSAATRAKVLTANPTVSTGSGCLYIVIGAILIVTVIFATSALNRKPSPTVAPKFEPFDLST